MKDSDPPKLTFREYSGKPEGHVAAAIPDFVTEAKEHGEHPPFTDRTVIDVLGDRTAANGPATITLAATAEDGGEVAGLIIVTLPAAKDGYATAELAVRPSLRRRHVAQRLLAFMKSRPSFGEFFPRPPENSWGRIRFWAHANSAAAQRLARSNGLVPLRTVWKMRLPSPECVQPAPLPGIKIRTFAVGRDEATWLEVNSKAFATHPEQGSVSLDELVAYENEDWFDPKGLFLAVTSDNEALGFVWTKIAGGKGEIYVLGVAPLAQGLGLGQFLLCHGINYLISQGAGGVVLHVDQDNAGAVRLYERNGFIPDCSDVLYGVRGNSEP